MRRVRDASAVALFNAVESGVPTWLVDVTADATGQSTASVAGMLSVSATTLHRKRAAGEPLRDVAGQRVMALLRAADTLRRLLERSGDAQALVRLDLDAWLARWPHEPLPELDGETPTRMLRNPEGLRTVEHVIERMRGGLPA